MAIILKKMNEILKKRIEEASEYFAHLYPEVSVADVITFRRDAFQAGPITSQVLNTHLSMCWNTHIYPTSCLLEIYK